MSDVLVDSNVLLDVFQDDPDWADWSTDAIRLARDNNRLCLNPIIYTELSIGFARIEELEMVLHELDLHLLEIPREALFLAGKAFLSYRRRGGARSSPLPDFFIGAHAAVSDLTLVTRDSHRYRSYYPSVDLISP